MQQARQTGAAAWTGKGKAWIWESRAGRRWCSAAAVAWRACAQQLAREGVSVTIAARNPERLEQAAAEIARETGIGVGWVSADLTQPAGRDAAIAACPHPDILINNADGPLPGDFRDWSHEDWVAALDAMMLGPIDMIRRVVDGMVERRFGRIVNIVSRSVKAPHAELGLSNGARSGLIGFVGGVARQTVRHNVTINNLLPGVFATDAQARHIRGMMDQFPGKSFEQVWDERGRSIRRAAMASPKSWALCAPMFVPPRPAT